MTEQLLLDIAAVIFLGIFAQWLSWRFNFPSILALLFCGFVAGPVVTDFVNPDRLLGDLLFPFVSISVAVILFEGGLSLRLADIPGVRGVILALISLGMLVTWFFGAWGAHEILGLSGSTSVLLGAILTVSGPTVVIPLLRFVRPKQPLSEILKWEGILIDPVGAILAVLVCETILTGQFSSAGTHILLGVLETVFIGTTTGVLGALVIIVSMRRYWIPEYLLNVFTLSAVVIVHVVACYFHRESGLLAVTLMGIILANTASISVQHILEFKENLRVLLISILFILLAARLNTEHLQMLSVSNSALFLAIMIFVARPAAVLVSSFRSGLNWRERAFLCWVAPRGIVAAAVASLFALEFAEAGIRSDASALVPSTFLVIVGTVVVYGLTSGWVARLLKVDEGVAEGILFLGAHSLARQIAAVLKDIGFSVCLVDTNYRNIATARQDKLPACQGNLLSESFIDELELDGIGKLLAMTPNHEANSLVALRLVDFFGRSQVYQLPEVKFDDSEDQGLHPQHLRGRLLFDASANFYDLEEKCYQGCEVKVETLTEERPFEKLRESYPETFLPLFLITDDEQLDVFTTESNLKPRTGQKVVALVKT